MSILAGKCRNGTRHIGRVGLFLLAASLPATSSAQIDIRATFTEGLAAYRTGSYAQAAELFGQCRELAPQVPEYGLWEATALIRAEEYREALPVLQAVLEYAPDSALARGHLGLVWHQLGSPQAAISELRSALSIDPAYDAARQNLSTVLMQQKRLDEAEALWRERLDQGLESALLREGLALVLERRGEYSQALAEAEAALALAPDSPDLIALSARLNLYAGSERVGLAQMASLDAPSVTHVEGFAAALLASGSVVDAIAHLEQPGIRDRLSAEGLATLAEGLRREGRWDELQPVLGQLVETRAFQRRWWPEDKAPVFATLAWLAERSGDRETATDWARQALNLDPAQPTALRILQGMRPGPEALAAIEAELIAGSTDIAAARYYLSETTRQPDHMPPAEVIAALQAWLPDEPDLLITLGLLALRAGAYGDAVSALERAVAAAPESAVAHNNLGAAYELTGRTDEAVAEYGTALRLDPDLAQARDNLERLRGGDDG